MRLSVTHDFSCFCAANTSVKIKFVQLMHLILNGTAKNCIWSIEGNGFLYNMVRIIAGTLWEVGTKSRDIRKC